MKTLLPVGHNSGRWNVHEQFLYESAVRKVGIWRHQDIAAIVGTRTVTQVRTHTQKVILRRKHKREKKLRRDMTALRNADDVRFAVHALLTMAWHEKRIEIKN
jgi:hypothetical protein